MMLARVYLRVRNQFVRVFTSAERPNLIQVNSFFAYIPKYDPLGIDPPMMDKRKRTGIEYIYNYRSKPSNMKCFHF